MVTENKASDDFTSRIKSLVDDAKRNTQWRKQYMEWEREKTYERDAGREEQALEDALMLIKKYNATPETAASDTGAPLDKVLEALKEPAPAN